jgi:small subunit ribosomal protein S21
MIHVKIEGNMTIDSALKKYKHKYIKIGIVKELNERKEFVKKSVKRRDEIKKAKYRELKRGNSEQ